MCTLQVDLSFPEHVSSDAKHLIEQLLVKDPDQRLSLDKVKVPCLRPGAPEFEVCLERERER